MDIPDGEYGVVDGAVRWLRQFRTAEQRTHLAEVLQDAAQRLHQGETPEAVAEQIEQATGLRVWAFLTSSRGAALAGWISAVLTLLAYLSQQGPTPAATSPPAVNVTVNMTTPPLVQDDPGQGDRGGRQRQNPDSIPAPAAGDVNGQHENPAASEDGQGQSRHGNPTP